jgi:uracil-DNA glycosylase
MPLRKRFSSVSELIPDQPTLPKVRAAAAGCKACRPWLEAEIALVKPAALVCLGATAAQGLLGRDFKVSQQRGERVESSLAPVVAATIHPSAILRAPDDSARQVERRRFVEDLRKVRGFLTTMTQAQP